MQFSTKLSLPLLFAAAVLSAPTKELATRGAETLYICTDINWGGECNTFVSYVGQCVSLINDFAATASSAGPDVGTGCELYTDSSCTSAVSLYLTYPGSANLVNNGFNDQARSFICYDIPA